MNYRVTIQTVQPRILAAVRKRVAMTEIASEVRPALDKVWAFVKQDPGLRGDGLHHRRESAGRVRARVERGRASVAPVAGMHRGDTNAPPTKSP